jgi:DUF971 family protein
MGSNPIPSATNRRLSGRPAGGGFASGRFAEEIRQAGRVEERFELIGLDVEREIGVTARFADGHTATFTVSELRSACPCATCRDLRDRGEAAWPRPGGEAPLAISDARFHGAWGVNITWNDGHSTGIYPFETLRRWSDS